MLAWLLWLRHSTRGDYKNLDASEALVFLKEKSPVLVDVRTSTEQSAGVIPGALCLPLNELGRRLAEIPAERPILVYCASGMRSRVAASQLCRAGRKDIASLSGGISAWQAAGQPVGQVSLKGAPRRG